MYALYVKNKPVSDRLLAENGKFFQTKQAELGDKMDLASYLLKPVQRLGKYSLFLDGISAGYFNVPSGIMSHRVGV